MYDINAIRENLKTLLATVTEIAYVYSRRNPNIEGYPAIVFDIVNLDNEILTNVENKRVITFRLYVIVEVSAQGSADANEVLDDAVKAVVEKLEDLDNLSLSSSVDFLQPVLGAREEVQTTQGLSVWQQIDLRVTTSSSVV